MSVNVYVFTQNMKLESFKRVANQLDINKKSIMLTSHRLFENECEYLKSIFRDVEFIFFGELLTDDENEKLDSDAYSSEITLWEYYREILKRKNEKIYEKITDRYEIDKGFVCNADLGVYKLFWLEKGFKELEMDYYFKKKDVKYEKFWVSEYCGKKVIFLGKMDRISYRMDLEWKHSFQDYVDYIEKRYISKDRCQYLTTLHEYNNCQIPDSEEFDVRYIQDGYLPNNYSSLYLKFKPRNVSYYAWDAMSLEAFNNSGVKAEIMPFRKIITLPHIQKHKLKKILVATSGPGDWTAQKNRSDEDCAIEAFIKIARNNPDLHIIYRCHPTWVHPDHNGINSIERVREYICYCGIPNIHVSSNIPEENLSDFCLSFNRSSLEEDLLEADLVFGEHSISMIDGGLKGIPFASYNFSNRRNFFEGITRYGFPYCTSIRDIQQLIDDFETDCFLNKYNDAIDKYNCMVNLSS